VQGWWNRRWPVAAATSAVVAALAVVVRTSTVVVLTDLTLAVVAVTAVTWVLVGRRRSAEAGHARFLEAVFDASATPTALAAADGTYLKVNAAFEGMLGYERHSLVGRNLLDLAPPEDHAGIVERLSSVDFETVMNERRYLRADGTVATIVQGVTKVTDVDGRPLFHAQLFDVTELTEAEARLEAVVRALPDPVFLIDADGRYALVHLPEDTDPAVPADHLVGKTFDEVLPSEDAAIALKAVTEAISTGRPVGYRHELAWSDGSRHVYDVKATPMGEQALVVARDVTREYADAAAIADRESRLRAVLSALPDLLVVFDAEGTYLDVVVPEGRTMSHDPADVIGRRVSEMAPDLAPGMIGAIRSAIATGRLQTFAYERPGKDGPRSFEARIGPAGEDRVVMITRDVTTERRRAAALAESLERHSAVFDRTALPALVMDLDGRFLQANAAACALFGRGETELLTLSAMRLCVPSARPAMASLALQLSSGAVAWGSFEAGVLRPDGETRPVIVSMSVIHGADGAPRYYLGQLTDVSELKAAQAALEAASERQRTVLRALPDFVIVAGPDRVVRSVHVPDGFLRSTGNSLPPPQEWVGRPLVDHIPPGSTSDVLRAVDAAEKTGLGTCEVPFSHPDGGVGWREVRVTTSSSGELVILTRDVSDARRAVHLLSEREALFRTLSDASPVIVLQLDREGRCVYVNERCPN
jgi:PAS domain S-box-containing protein